MENSIGHIPYFRIFFIDTDGQKSNLYLILILIVVFES